MTAAFVLAAALVAAPAAQPASPQDRPPAYTNAEACLRQNADRAVAASSGAVDAAEFMLDYLCAEQVDAARRYERNSAYAAQITAAISAATAAANRAADAAVDAAAAATGEDVDDEESPFELETMFGSYTVDPVTGHMTSTGTMGDLSNADATTAMLSNQVPSFLRLLAAQLIVERRR